MTDNNLPPVTPPAANQPTPPPAAPAYNAPAAAPQAYSADGYGQAVGPDKFNVLAIISLITAFFVSLAAVITGHIALSQIKKTGEKGRGLAIAGLVLGYLGLIGGIIAIVLFFVIGIAAVNDPSFTTTY
jgi:ABC-type spermidine/putrescine transport system permease subunit II